MRNVTMKPLSPLAWAVAAALAAPSVPAAGAPRSSPFPDLAARIPRPPEGLTGFLAVSAADFDGDGRIDFAGPTRWSNAALVRQGPDGWTWKSLPIPDEDQERGASASADLDGDGLPDLAAAIESGDTFTFYGARDEGLVPGPSPLAEDDRAGAIAAADLDGDGIGDLAVVGEHRGLDGEDTPVLVVVLGWRNRSFITAGRIPLAGPAVDVALRDFDGDGMLEIAVLRHRDQGESYFYLDLFRGHPDGGTISSSQVEGQGIFLAAGDVDGDGKAELVIPSTEESLLRVLRLDEGAFVVTGYAPAFHPAAASCAGLDGSGRDEVLVLEGDETLAAFRANGAGGLDRAGSYLGAGRLVTPPADVDGDGRPDVALFDDKGIVLLRGTGDGALVAPPALAAFSPDLFALREFSPDSIFQRHLGALAAVDVDGDGAPDLLWLRGSALEGDHTSIELAVARGRGDGTFAEPTRSRIAEGPGYEPCAIALGDLDGDGAPDVVFADFGGEFPERAGQLVVLRGKGDGTFRPVGSWPAGVHPMALAVGRVDGDAHEDVVVDAWEGLITVFPGNGDGTLRPGASFPIGRGLARPVLADLDGDGEMDFAAVSPDRPSLEVFFGDGGGGFDRRSFDPAATGRVFSVPILAADPATSPASLIVGDASGFGRYSLAGRRLAAVETLVDRQPVGELGTVADLDGDGRKELLLSGFEELEVFAAGEKEPVAVSPSSTAPRDIAVADLDGDGLLDVVTLGYDIAIHRQAARGRFIRGDAVGDGGVDITDAVGILVYLFLGDAAMAACLDAADANGDGGVDITDPVSLLAYQFLGGPPPPAPFPGCGSPAAPGPGCRLHPFCR